MEGCSSEMAAFSQNMLTVSVLLSVFLHSGVQTGCKDKNPDISITATKKIEALSESCLLIPCSFREIPGKPEEKFDNKREIFGVWIKNDPAFGKNLNNVIYNSSLSQNSYAVKISGNLREKNCTSVFSNVNSNQRDKYFFRIENGPFRATADCDPVHITVRDFPWSPSIEISGDVKEKNSVTVTCSALTPCPQSPPEFTWNLQPNPHRQTERNTDGTFTTTIQQDISLSEIHDGYNIFCSARYPVDGGEHKTGNTEVTLSVSYAPKETSAARWVELLCSSRVNPPISCSSWVENSTYKARIVTKGDVRFIVYGGEIDCWELSDSRQFRDRVCTGVKILGLVTLCCLTIIIECRSRSVFIKKQEKDAEEADDNNRVTEM